MNNPLGKAINRCKIFFTIPPQIALLAACTSSRVCRTFLGMSVGFLFSGLVPGSSKFPDDLSRLTNPGRPCLFGGELPLIIGGTKI